MERRPNALAKALAAMILIGLVHASAAVADTARFAEHCVQHRGKHALEWDARGLKVKCSQYRVVVGALPGGAEDPNCSTLDVAYGLSVRVPQSHGPTRVRLVEICVSG